MTKAPPPLTTDVLIVGAGPVGLFAVFECGMLKMRAHVVDALDAVGGQCTALYPDKPIYDIPGIPRTDAAGLIERLAEQAAPFAPVYHLGQRVETLEQFDGGRFRAVISAGTAIEAAAVIIAAGAGAFGPNRPPLPGIEDYEGRSVHYFVRRRDDFRGKRVVIAGGGDSAVDWAVSLAEVAARVHLVHRRAKFRAAPESVARLEALAKAGTVEFAVPFQLHGLEGSDGQLAAVILRDLDDAERRIEADALLPFFGIAAELGPVARWGVAVERHRIPVRADTLESNVAGIHAVGDVADYPGKLKLILNGFAEAAMAAHAIYPRVHPGEALHWEYSTTKGVPGRD